MLVHSICINLYQFGGNRCLEPKFCPYLSLFQRAIDNDVTLDDELEERGRDAEESYFDSESPAPAPSLEIPNEETMDILGAPKK